MKKYEFVITYIDKEKDYMTLSFYDGGLTQAREVIGNVFRENKVMWLKDDNLRETLLISSQIKRIEIYEVEDEQIVNKPQFDGIRTSDDVVELSKRLSKLGKDMNQFG